MRRPEQSVRLRHQFFRRQVFGDVQDGADAFGNGVKNDHEQFFIQRHGFHREFLVKMAGCDKAIIREDACQPMPSRREN